MQGREEEKEDGRKQMEKVRKRKSKVEENIKSFLPPLTLLLTLRELCQAL